jgi:aspartyl aminopeptidase
MATKKIIEPEIKEPVKEKHKPFLDKGYVFSKEDNSRWLINTERIPEIIKELYTRYENWFNYTFNNECICPIIFIEKSDRPIFTKRNKYG